MYKPASTEIKWDAADYAANSAQQQAWARERIAKLDLRGGEHILDAGCGDGKVTAEFAGAVPRGWVTGIDSSAEMIAFASAKFPARRHPNLEFMLMDARKIRLPQRYDFVFSSATLHWVEDHPAFLRGAAGVLKPDGRLVTTSGGRGNAQDVFVAVRAEMRAAAWRECFRNLRKPYFFHGPDEYRQWLDDAGFRAQSVRLAEKDMAHAGPEGLAAWLRTTWLPYTQRVPVAQREQFIARVVERYVAKHPPDEDGRVHVRMVRLEIDATRI